MSSLKRVLICSLYLSLILSACSSPVSTKVWSAATLVPPSPQPTLPPATFSPTTEPVSIGVPMIEYLNEQPDLVLISSINGKRFDHIPPITLGTYYNYAFSPDGKTLAVVSSGQLHLIDLPSWRDRASDVGLHGPISSVVYSRDGTLLALASGLPDGELRMVDTKSGQVTASTPTGFRITYVKFTTDGKALMVYGPHLANTGVAANAGVSIGAPEAELFAVSDLSPLWSVELAGVRDGTFPKKADTANTQDIYQPGAAWHFEPGIAFAPENDILYLVHGDKDKLTIVDCANRKVRTIDIHVNTSWLDQLLALSAGVAYAKGMDGTTKQAVISPDGKLLFVGGNTEAVAQQANGTDWNITNTSLGLQVIAIKDGTLVEKINMEASPFYLATHGRQIFLTGWKDRIPWTGIFDMSSRRIIKHLDGIYLVPTRRLDGKAVLVSNKTSSNNINEIALIDPDTWATISEWKGTDNAGWLMDP